MEFQNILNLLQTVFSLIVAGIALYLKFSTKAQTKAKEVQEVISEISARAVIYIREAEENYKDTTKAGGEKFAQVVDKLYALVPEGLNKIITREMIEEIVQSTFNEIEEYARTALDKAVDKINVKSE